MRSFRNLLTALPAIGMALTLSVSPAGAAQSTTTTPFAVSSIAADSYQPSTAATPLTSGTRRAGVVLSSASVSVGSNINVIGKNDVVQQATINGVAVKTCNPGKNTAQNETTIAAIGSTLVGGANDYRLYEPSENRYDASGGFYRSTNGGTSWSAGFLPGLVRANPTAPGPYESAGDPSVSAGPNNTFWYANLAFDRTNNANSVAVSRSTDGGASWTTSFVFQTPATQGTGIFNDKEWIGADPNNADAAYVTWTQFAGSSSPIVISKTTDGGATWSAPQRVSNLYALDQGSTVVVDTSGTVHVTFESFNGTHDEVIYARSTDGGATFNVTALAPVDDIPSPLPGATFRDDSFPALALDGSTLHVVWSNWNGSNADVDYMRSLDGGITWSNPPLTLAGGAGDQFFPWIAARNGKVYASWFNRAGGDDSYSIAGSASDDGGATWTAPITLSSATSNVTIGNQFSYPSCLYNFIGDYNAITVDAAGVGHPLWTDIRKDNFDPAKGGADQDPYTATFTVS